MKSAWRKSVGFTLIELIVVMLIISMLVAIALPKYMGHVQKSKDTVLRENLVLMRDALDKFYGDYGKYPDALDNLVTKRYLRSIPIDPITESALTWQTVPPEDAEKGNVFDVHSGSEAKAGDGTPYKEW